MMSEQAEIGTLRITLVRSTIGRPKDQALTVRSLGLRRLHHSVERPDDPTIRGMVAKISHLVRMEVIAPTPIPRGKRSRPAPSE